MHRDPAQTSKRSCMVCFPVKPLVSRSIVFLNGHSFRSSVGDSLPFVVILHVAVPAAAGALLVPCLFPAWSPSAPGASAAAYFLRSTSRWRPSGPVSRPMARIAQALARASSGCHPQWAQADGSGHFPFRSPGWMPRVQVVGAFFSFGIVHPPSLNSCLQSSTTVLARSSFFCRAWSTVSSMVFSASRWM